MINPYFGKHLGGFLWLFLQRMKKLLSEDLSLSELASDEIQVLVLMLVAISSAAVGTFLVLKKMTMLANSLSHTILLGIVTSYLILTPFFSESFQTMSLQMLLIAAFATGLITTVLTQMLTHVFKLQEDASTGLVFTTLFALGVVLVTIFTRNTHLGTEAIMGNVDALHLHDLKGIFWIALLDFAVLFLFFKEFKITAFDPLFAKAQGVSSLLFSYLLMILTSATAIGGFRAVGVLLILAFLVGPVLTARLFTNKLIKLFFLAMGIGAVVAFFSVALSRHLLSVHHLPVSTSGLAATLLGLVYFLSVGGCYGWRRR